MRIFGCYTSVRRGNTGREFLGQHLYENFRGTNWSDTWQNGLQYIGYLEGEGDLLSSALQSIEPQFSFKRLTEDEFYGAVALYYTPVLKNPLGSGDATYSWFEYLGTRGFVPSVDDQLLFAKLYKQVLIKEISKKKFYDDNDAIADLAKITSLFSVYDDSELTTEQITVRNDLRDRLKIIYTPEVCIAGGENLVGLLENILSGYYTVKTRIESASNLDTLKTINFE